MIIFRLKKKKIGLTQIALLNTWITNLELSALNLWDFSICDGCKGCAAKLYCPRLKYILRIYIHIFWYWNFTNSSLTFHDKEFVPNFDRMTNFSFIKLQRNWQFSHDNAILSWLRKVRQTVVCGATIWWEISGRGFGDICCILAIRIASFTQGA